MKDENLITKTCKTCNEEKLSSEFRYQHNCCRHCENLKNREYLRTKKGLISGIYSRQKSSSRLRGHDMPNYTLNELREWAFNQAIFHRLHTEWVRSGYKKDKTPSCDRLDDYKPYAFDNLQLITWYENWKKCNNDVINGINNKLSKSVVQMTLDGKFIVEHYSIAQAVRVTRAVRGNIRACCQGKRKTAGGFKWEFA